MFLVGDQYTRLYYAVLYSIHSIYELDGLIFGVFTYSMYKPLWLSANRFAALTCSSVPVPLIVRPKTVKLPAGTERARGARARGRPGAPVWDVGRTASDFGKTGIHFPPSLSYLDICKAPLPQSIWHHAVEVC